MIKEIKYLIFLIFISLFIFLTIKYYFSDNNKKNSYRSLVNIDKKIEIYSKKLPIEITGTGTKKVFGYNLQTAKKLSLSQLSGIIDYQKEELYIKVKAGTPVQVLKVWDSNENGKWLYVNVISQNFSQLEIKLHLCL